MIGSFMDIGRAVGAYRPIALSRQFGRRFMLDHLLPFTGKAAERDYSLAGMVARRVLYVHVPKVAGISVLKALSGNAGMGHMSIREYQAVLRPRYMAGAKVMTTVRNSFNRVHSAYIRVYGPTMKALGYTFDGYSDNVSAMAATLAHA